MCASTAKMIYQVLGWLGAMLFLIAYYQLIAKKNRPPRLRKGRIDFKNKQDYAGMPV